MGGFLGIGHSSAKTDRSNTLKGIGELGNTFNFGLDTAKSMAKSGSDTTGTGVNALTTTLDHYKRLLSGDRTAVAGEIAPEANAVQSQGDASRRQQVASGTARGGGTAGANQQQHDADMAKIDNLLFGARSDAAKGETAVGTALAQVGLHETDAALGFGTLAEKSASDTASISADSRKTSFEINRQTQQDVSNAIQAVMGAFA